MSIQHVDIAPVKSAPGATLAPILDEIRERADKAVADGDLEAAVQEYHLVTNLAPTDLHASHRFAHFLAATGRQAQASIEYLRLAGLYVRAEQEHEALITAKQALATEPASLIRHRMTLLVFRMGTQMDSVCERAIKAHVSARRLTEARDLMHLMVDADPTSANKRMRLARMELKLGRISEAVRYLRNVVKMYRASGRTVEYIPAAELLLTHGGPNRQVLRELSEIYLRFGRYERALGKLEALHTMAPGDVETLERLAMVLSKFGRVGDAIDKLRLLIRQMRRSGKRRQVLETLRRAQGWSESEAYHTAFRTLVRMVLPKAEASKLSGKGWVFFGDRPSRRIKAPMTFAPVPVKHAHTQPMFT